jgi:M6 family metalloprotease-like protein
VPLDFPDTPASDPASDYRAILEPPAETWFREVSYGRTELELTTMDEWQRMSKPVADYGLQQCCPSERIKEFMQEAIALIDPMVDFSGIDAVFMVGPKESGSALNILLFRPWPGQGIMADGKELRFGVVGNGNYRPGEEHLLAHHLITHEMGHLLGLPDLYGRACPTCGGTWDWAGAWDIMSDDRPSAHYFAWHKWLLGWLDPQQLRGLTDRGQVEEVLTPIETPGGVKAIVIPLSPFKSYVIEIRRLIDEDAQLCDEGVLVWLVDSSLRNASGNAQVMTGNNGSDPAQLEQCGVKYDAPYDVGAGEVSVFTDAGAGVTVEVLQEMADGSYLVRASRAKTSAG